MKMFYSVLGRISPALNNLEIGQNVMQCETFCTSVESVTVNKLNKYCYCTEIV